jgi:hypothetical protein
MCVCRALRRRLQLWDPSHVLQVQLEPQSAEFRQLADKFHNAVPKATRGSAVHRPGACTITHITRIQNFMAWGMFVAKGENMRLLNSDGIGANMQELWHGTDYETTKKVHYCARLYPSWAKGVISILMLATASADCRQQF